MHRSIPRPQAQHLISMTLAIVAATTSPGCGGGDDTLLTSGQAPRAGSAGAAGSNADAIYVVFTTIDTPDGRSGYFATTPSIEGDVAVDVLQGFEEPGGGQLYAPPEQGYFLFGSGEAPTFTRYDVGPAGDLQRGRTLSFANLGVADVWRHMIFVDDSKAYFLDLTQLQVISFNPTTMALNGTIPVDDFECEGETQTEFGEPIARDDGYYFTRSCWDLDVTSAGSSLVHLDPVTDTVTVSHDTRCMGMQVGFLADSGNAYWFADHDASMEWSVQQRNAPHDCALRLRAGETTFDPSWELDLTARTGGVSAVGSVPAGGSSIWVKVFEPAAMPEPVPVEVVDYTLKVWRWGMLDVESNTPVQLQADSDLVVYYGPHIQLGDRRFSPVTTFSDVGDETTLVELTTSGIVPRMTVPGELRKVVRLR